MYWAVMANYYDLAERQYGTFNLEQTRRRGISDDEICRRATRGELIREYDGVYRIAGASPTFHQRCMVATLVSSNIMISHGATRALLGVPGFEPGRIEATMPHGCEYVLRGVKMHWSRHMSPEDCVVRYGIRCT